MVRSNSSQRYFEEERCGQASLFLRNTREWLQLVYLDDREVKASLKAIIEEGGIDDFSDDGREAERDVRDAEDRLDLRDLLFDEAD